MNHTSHFHTMHLTGNDGFYTDDIETTPDNVKYAGKSKFEPKVLVWVAISSKGVSASLIRPNKAKAVNADVYISQCLPKLKQFIERYHAHDEFMFWPDLASCHYAKKNVKLAQQTKDTICAKNGQSSKRTTGTSNRKLLGSSQAYGER